jgi:hypothetical protein
MGTIGQTFLHLVDQRGQTLLLARHGICAIARFTRVVSALDTP